MPPKPLVSSKYNRDNIKRYSSLGYYSDYGRSYVYIVCPFCDTEVKAFVWSLAGSGKKCPSCKALHTNHGYSIPLKQEC